MLVEMIPHAYIDLIRALDAIRQPSDKVTIQLTFQLGKDTPMLRIIIETDERSSYLGTIENYFRTYKVAGSPDAYAVEADPTRRLVEVSFAARQD